jgi:hypothetical protein
MSNSTTVLDLCSIVVYARWHRECSKECDKCVCKLLVLHSTGQSSNAFFLASLMRQWLCAVLFLSLTLWLAPRIFRLSPRKPAIQCEILRWIWLDYASMWLTCYLIINRHHIVSWKSWLPSGPNVRLCGALVSGALMSKGPNVRLLQNLTGALMSRALMSGNQKELSIWQSFRCPGRVSFP